MAKQANTTMIGGFVVIAFFLLAVSVVILGSGKLFQQTTSFVLYFDNSIKGLNVGAPVSLQGVQIGSVTSIVIHANHQNLTMTIPVIIEVQQNRFHVEDENSYQRDPEETVEKLVQKGLRAVLSMQSLITGQLMIELDYHSDSPVSLKRINSEYTEIPTIQSTTERMFQNLQKIDFTHLENTIAGLDRLINSPDLSEGLRFLRQTADESRQLVGKLNSRIDDVIDNVDNTVSDTRTLVNDVNAQFQPLVYDMRQLIKHFDGVVLSIDKQVDVIAENVNKSLIGFRGVVSEDAPLVIELEQTMENISNMTDSIRQLADYLEQHPEALLRGKNSN